MKKYLPFIKWLSQYQKKDISGDLVAGITVGIMLIPQGMAYAMLANMPPIYGLYAATIPLIIYALLGTSRQLAVGPVALVSLLIGSGVGSLVSPQSPEFISYVILLSMMVGVILLLMSIFRLGFLVNFLSHPVLAGFTSAAAIIIGLSQMKHLLGINIPRGKSYETLWHIIQNINETHWITFAIGGFSIFILIFLKKVSKKIPSQLVIVLIGILLVALIPFIQQSGIRIVKDIPSGLPAFKIPNIDIATLKMLFPTALTIALIGFMESIAVAKVLEAKHKNYSVNSNQELLALGMANFLGSFFQSFPVMGGFGRSAVNNQSGAKTGLASLISAFIIILILLFFTSFFYYLPNAVLAAIIIVAVSSLIEIKEAKYLWKTDRKDFWLFLATALGTLILGVEQGIILGIVLSLLMLIYKVSYPHVAELGYLKEVDEYRNIKRFPNAIQYEDILIIRFDAQLFFANLEFFKNDIQKRLIRKPKTQHLIIDFRAIDNIDSSGLHAIHDVYTDCKNKNISLYLVDVKGPVREMLKKADLVQLLGKAQYFLNVHRAVNFIQGKPIHQSNKDVVLQTNK